MTENIDTIIHKYFDNLIINPVALQNAFPKLSRKTGIVVSGPVVGPGYDLRYKNYKNPPPHWAQGPRGAPKQPHPSTWQYPIGAGAVRTILKLSQKEINKLEDGTIMITFKHPSQILFNKGTILTIGRILCCDKLLRRPPSQINLNSQVGAYRRAFSNNTKRKKVQKNRRYSLFGSNEVKSDELCCGLRSNGMRCTRKKKDGNEKFCGTHVKGTPHGTI